jgi:hypothetical protein
MNSANGLRSAAAQASEIQDEAIPSPPDSEFSETQLQGPAPWNDPMGCYNAAPGFCPCGNYACNPYMDPAVGPVGYALQSRLWFRGEYLMWWMKAADAPPLATTSPANTPPSQAGVLQMPGTSTLFGGNPINEGIRSGGRFTIGWWTCPCCQSAGFEATFLFLANQSVGLHASNQTNSILAQPYFDVQASAQSSAIIAYPGTQTGSLAIGLKSSLNVLDLAWREALVMQDGFRVDYLVGYRNAFMNEAISESATTTYTAANGSIAAGTSVARSDRFNTSSAFNGAVVGVTTQNQRGPWTLDLLAKIGFGETRSHVTIEGSSLTTVPQLPPTASPGGLYALPSNIGHYQKSSLSMLPEVGTTLGYYITDHLQLTFGYTFLYWTRMMRPGDQIDPALNLSQQSAGGLMGTASPLYHRAITDFWVQGLSFGTDYRF